ncbi:hypothetical protein I858_004475 [Planococcus versutus]|uniref:Uncharacterized protein n=1 Tax=Planococcus versutus TaxID=1302659 RepID=A0A1B1RZD9_9BACL|nr:hypothetical protein I858_004475 [Planococcus versutus]
MNLRNLNTYVPTVLYKRGLDYFERDFVEQLAEDAPNRWHAFVAGTHDYEVIVKLSGESPWRGLLVRVRLNRIRCASMKWPYVWRFVKLKKKTVRRA